MLISPAARLENYGMDIPQRIHIYRITVRCAIVVAALFLIGAVGAHAQRKKDTPRGPRAIALIQWQAGANGKAVAKLVPITILVDGKYFDASFYPAQPRPLAVEPETVYKAQRQGEDLGAFTIQRAIRDIHSGGWIGLGEWEASIAKPEFDFSKRSQPAIVVMGGKSGETAAPNGRGSDEIDQHRKQTKVYDEEGREIPADQDQNKDGARPRGEKREAIDRNPTVAPPRKSEETKTNADDDPDRPRFKRPPASGEAKPPTPAANAGSGRPESKANSGSDSKTTTSDSDPDRPVLRRGKPKAARQEFRESGDGSENAAPVPIRIVEKSNRPGVATAAARVEGQRETYEVIAISDATPEDVDVNYRYRMLDDEREELTEKMTGMARQEVKRYLETRAKSLIAAGETLNAQAAPKPSRSKNANLRSKVAANPPDAESAFDDVRMDALDLDMNNNAESVFTASQAAPANRAGRAKRIFVTVVVRLDIQGNPRKLFASVTDDSRLDAFPRLELIDAVDADGDKRAELLFRSISDRGAKFALYKVGPDELIELFSGGSAR